MPFIFALISVIIVSLIALIGVFTLYIKKEKLEKFLIYFVSLSAGTLLGDAFIHLIPEAYETGEARNISIYILAGIVIFFLLEKFIHWRHCHLVACETHPHPFSYTILAGDTIHNFIDGLIIGGSYLVSIPIGIATTLAVIFHEIPQEIGDFGSLIYGGFSKKKALLFNFLTGLAAVFGTVLVFIFSGFSEIKDFLVPFAAGGFIYIASTDLIPEMKKHCELRDSLKQLFFFVLGISLMAGLLIIFE